MNGRKRGRPVGSRDSKPRRFLGRTMIEDALAAGCKTDAGDIDYGVMMSVEERLRKLNRPVRVSLLAAICGLSVATLRKKVLQGKIKAFKRSGILLVEPSQFLEYWLGGYRG